MKTRTSNKLSKNHLKTNYSKELHSKYLIELRKHTKHHKIFVLNIQPFPFRRETANSIQFSF